MVDLHAHLLPGVDDGAATLAETVRFARELAARGIHDAACTPHVKRAHFPRIDLAELAALREHVQRTLDEQGVAVRLHGGGELAHVDALALEEAELALIAQGPADAPWLLLECPFEGFSDAFDAAAARLTALGYGLLLAHPERADGGFERLPPLIEAGALLQVNASSLFGDHGPRARAGAESLVRRGLAYCLASDAHPGTRERTLDLGAAALARLGVPDTQVFRLTQSNPRFLLRHGNPRLAPPVEAARVNSG